MFNTPYNYTNTSQSYEPCSSLGHETTPDMSYSVRTLLTKFQKNLLPDIAKNPHYEENPTFDDFDQTLDPAFDLADYTRINNTISNNKTHLQNLKSSYMDAKARTTLTDIIPTETEKVEVQHSPSAGKKQSVETQNQN